MEMKKAGKDGQQNHPSQLFFHFTPRNSIARHQFPSSQCLGFYLPRNAPMRSTLYHRYALDVWQQRRSILIRGIGVLRKGTTPFWGRGSFSFYWLILHAISCNPIKLRLFLPALKASFNALPSEKTGWFAAAISIVPPDWGFRPYVHYGHELCLSL